MKINKGTTFGIFATLATFGGGLTASLLGAKSVASTCSNVITSIGSALSATDTIPDIDATATLNIANETYTSQVHLDDIKFNLATLFSPSTLSQTAATSETICFSAVAVVGMVSTLALATLALVITLQYYNTSQQPAYQFDDVEKRPSGYRLT